MTKTEFTTPPNFIRNIVAEDMKSNKFGGRVMTRFSRTERILAHWACQIRVSELRLGCGIWGLVQFSLR